MKKLITLLIFIIPLAACSSMTTMEKDQQRNALDTMATTAIEGLIEKDSNIKTQVDQSLGYGVANMKLTKVPIVGAAGGEGVFINQNTQERTYFTVSRLDLGGGWGARSYKVLLIAKSQEMVDRMESGTWEFQAGVEGSVGTAAVEGSSGVLNTDFSVHVLSDGGVSATATARSIHIKVNKKLIE